MQPLPTAAPVRFGRQLARFEAIDQLFIAWAHEWHGMEAQFPALIARRVLEQAEYPEAFPHLLLSACRCSDPTKPAPTLLAAANLSPSGWLLSPAVCYHAYPHWAGQTLTEPQVLTARGRCFRHEDEFVPGRRQLEFEMREIVLCGSPEWIEQRTSEARGRIEALAESAGFRGSWEVAADPFFLPTAQGKALMQRLQETKCEFVVRQPTSLAVASINRHGTFFGERFDITLASGARAHTACIAVGLDRWDSCQPLGPSSYECRRLPCPEPTLGR
jgi:hypothetical protein